jgi:sarcosine oxidase, subunit alpha
MSADPGGCAERLGEGFGRLVDRARPVRFGFEGREVGGYEGDVIASALLGGGRMVLSRSFKYRRPRGAFSMAGHDANALVQVGAEPNVAADRRAISPGLEVRGQNYAGSLDRDRGAWIGHLGRFLPAGFYYETFFRPRFAWPAFERMIRDRAGLGVVDRSARHKPTDKAYGFADVAVVGGGPAGMAAALAAARAGLEVWLIEEGPVLGGCLCYARDGLDGETAWRQRGQLVEAVAAEPSIRVLTDAVCQGLFDDLWLPVIQGRRLHKLRARRVVLAQGVVEQPLVFRNNDLPGVMPSSGVQRLMRLYGVRPGHRALVATAGPQGYELALDLLEAGIEVAAIVDLIGEAPGSFGETLAARRVPVHAGWTVVEAVGRGRVAGARIARITGRGRADGRGERIDCDVIATAIGEAPSAGLLLQAGGRMRYDESLARAVPAQLPAGVLVAGGLSGSHDLERVIAEGRLAGWRAAHELGAGVGGAPALPAPVRRGGHPWPIFPHPGGKEFVDLDEDLTVADMGRGARLGYDDVELLKRFTTLGMGPSQGRHSSLNGARLLAEATGRSVADVGATTSRPPFWGESFRHLAGRAFEPVRLTPMHGRHLDAGAEIMVAGPWLRPAHYGSIAGEVRRVREGVGLIDVSTLGKLEIRGPDAALFMERIYTGRFERQPTGRARYVLALDETGAIVDDGIACRLGERHFYVTATTGAVDQLHRQMLWWNAQWRLSVDITQVTAAWAAVNIAGPDSRRVLAGLAELDLSPEAFPYMGVREGRVAGIPARLLRVGFVGELGYEIHVPAGMGEALWDALTAAGEVRPFGVEAQRLLRLEKGHIIVGQDTDGLTHPLEAGMGWAVAMAKPFFVGKRALEALTRDGIRRRLVGFGIPDPARPVPKEGHLVLDRARILGRVTSCARSPTLGRAIGLAYVPPERAAPGTRLAIKAAHGRMTEAEVIPTPFVDPEGARQKP